MKTGSGFSTAYTYEDHRNVKTAVSNSLGNTAVSTYTYEYDELGRRKSVKNTGSAFTNPNFNIYGYNDRSEVTASSSFYGDDLANKNNPLADRGRAYNYDPIGNRKTATEAVSNFAYSANSLNQYESISGGANPETPAYDLDGNMTVSKGMVFSYNAENRLIEASPQNPQQGSLKSTYIYDYMGRRAQKTLYTYSSGSWQKQKDVSFIYDGWNMVKESEKTSDSSPEVPVYYVWGLDLSQSMQGAGGVGGLIASVKTGNEYLYSFDANGNVGQMVKASDGSIAARYEYDPFGKTIFSEGPLASENPYRFSTKYQDAETGFYYYGYRFYYADLGRWINRDPIGESGGVGLSLFSRNNSISQFDQLGLLTPMTDAEMRNAYFRKTTIQPTTIWDVLNFPADLLFGDKGEPAHSLEKKFCYKGKFFEIIFMNGIMNTLENVEMTASAIQVNLNMGKPNIKEALVGYVHNKTGLFNMEGNQYYGLGFANKMIGIPYDIIQTAFNQAGMKDDTTRFLGNYVNKRMAADSKLNIILVGHSQGGAKVRNGFDDISMSYRDRVKVVTAAGAQIQGFEGSESVRINRFPDPVSIIIGNNGPVALLNRLLTGGNNEKDPVWVPAADGWTLALDVVANTISAGLYSHDFANNYAKDTDAEIREYLESK